MRRDISGQLLALVAIGYFCLTDIGLAAEEKGGPPEATVAVNANLAGCASLEVLNWSIDKDLVSAHIVLRKNPIDLDPSKRKYPCVCRGGSYFYLVYPRDVPAADDTVWTQSVRPFKRDFSIGLFKLKERGRYDEVIRFSSRLVDGKNSKFYYLVLGCH